MNRNIFKVIEGGMSGKSTPNGENFKSAWVTDTRLMGVLCVGITWEGRESVFNQFFYYDAEEFGFERYESISHPVSTADNDNIGITARQILTDTENSLIGGLGGTKVDISFHEAVYLVKNFIKFNKDNGIPLPDNSSDYIFITRLEAFLTPRQEHSLFDKCCVELANFNSLANYFLMRCIGRDFDAAKFLALPEVKVDIFPEFSYGTFYNNKVKLSREKDRAFCRSLIEVGNQYYILSTELSFKGMKVSDYICTGLLPITEREAYLQLSHSEFIMTYKYDGDPEDFSRSATRLTKRAMIHNEHGGLTFMLYHPNNSHLDLPDYYLYNDLLGIYHMGEDNEFLAASATLRGIRRLELDINTSPVKKKLTLQGNYEFNEPVLLQYLESDFTNFEEYINAISVEGQYPNP
ncbi:MAG: hypothetical protein SOR72_06420 [Hornefia sp.]|nr:hypothetical protein [Hornefia sp.]